MRIVRARERALRQLKHSIMFRTILFLFFLLPTFFLHGQVSFKKRFGTAGNDEARFVEVLSDNSFIVAGGSTGPGFGGQDAMLVKFSANGTVEWSRVYGGTGNEFFMNILACSDGNYIALGESSSFGAGSPDIYVVKFDINGNVLWQRNCGGNNLEQSRGICEVSDGYIVTGGTQSYGGGNWDLFIEKFDFTGVSIWCKVIGNTGGDIAGDPLPISNGDIWIGGFVFVASNNHDPVLIRLDPNGTMLSITRINASGNENHYRLRPGGPAFVGSGSTWTYSGNSQLQPWLLGFNSSGTLEWAKRYIIPTGNYEMYVENCPDGGFIFTPSNVSNDTGEAYLAKLDGSGNIVWAKTHSYNGSGRMFSAKPCPDGGYVAIGYCTGNNLDMFILKTDATGNVTGCCPMDAPITAAAVTPVHQSKAVNTVTCPAANTPSAPDQGIDLNEVNLCTGECCDTEAGTMVVLTLHACINQPATFTHNGDEVLDGNDLLQFILFSDPADTLGSIIAISNTPTFTFDPSTMQTGVTYYVAAIAGNNVGGNVDFDDPCFDLSNAAELIWHPLPEVVLQTDNSDVCAGGCQTINATFVGTPPFTLTVSSPAGTASFTFQSNSGTFDICPPPGTPPGSFTVQATALTDTFCTCP